MLRGISITKSSPIYDETGFSYVLSTESIGTTESTTISIHHIFSKCFYGLKRCRCKVSTTVVSGSIVAIVVNGRRQQTVQQTRPSTLGDSCVIYLDRYNKSTLNVPEDYYYGFVSLEETTVIISETTPETTPERSESSLEQPCGISYESVFDLYQEQFVIDNGIRLQKRDLVVSTEDRQYRTFTDCFGVDVRRLQ